jgi:ribose transport system ATP-binding protein
VPSAAATAAPETVGARRGTYSAVGVGKAFSRVTVLENVDFELRSGEVHALLGENGSGKSTLIKILSGAHSPTTGHLERDGRTISVYGPAQALRQGLAVVYQDYQLFPDLDVATNIAAAKDLPRRRLIRSVDHRQARRRAVVVLSNLGLEIDPRELVRNLGLAEWKLVEIARALMANASFLVLDEPTALLDRKDSERILVLIERLREEGVGVAFVSHRLDEALRVADRITVLRDGKLVTSIDRTRATPELLVQQIIGSKGLEAPQRQIERQVGDEALRLEEVQALPDAEPFDLVLRRGEVVGLTGLVGSGAMEVARMLGGRRRLTGRVFVYGRETRVSSPAHAIRAGIGYVPEDRGALGLVQHMSVGLNISLASMRDVSTAGFVRRPRVDARARRYADEMAIRAPSLRAPIRTLSGGNQQKVQIAKWLAPGQKILVIESPTHGVDVGAKVEIHRLLREFAAAGGSIIVASTDIPEVLSIADRVAVFNRGDVVQEVTAAESAHGEILLSGAHDRQVAEIEQLLER